MPSPSDDNDDKKRKRMRVIVAICIISVVIVGVLLATSGSSKRAKQRTLSQYSPPTSLDTSAQVIKDASNDLADSLFQTQCAVDYLANTVPSCQGKWDTSEVCQTIRDSHSSLCSALKVRQKQNALIETLQAALAAAITRA